MNGPRALFDRVREERRTRREFERLIAAQNFAFPDNLLRGARAPRVPMWRRGWKWWVPRVALVVTLVLLTVTVAVLFAPLPFEPPTPLQTAFVYDREGNLLARLHTAEDRVVLPLKQIPKIVQQAVIASEDERFFHHPGVDLWAVMRAAWRDLTGNHSSIQGGSTITQQLVKQYYVGSERSLWRKLREAILAVRLEHKYSKNEILEQYLNRIYLGEGAYGVEAAAQTYFDRPVRKLTLSQAALIAGIAPAPSVYDPRKDPRKARARRDYVLERMAANGFITSAQAEAAKREPLRVAKYRPPVTKDPYFVDYVRRQVIASFGDDQLYRGGLQIGTTLDQGMQDAAERAIAEILNQPGDPAAALVSIDVRNGAIRALVGGRNFRRSPFNLATQGRRQAGSAFKPFVLATALTKGISPYHYYDAPGTLDLHGWNVSTYDRNGYGYINIVTGTVYSVNTLYAQLILDVGPRSVAGLAHRMGISSHLEADPTLTLGTSAVSPLEMASAYATLASGGVYHRPTAVQWIKDAGGEVLQSLGRPAGKRVLKRTVAEETTAILQKVVESGTGTAAALDDYVVAGKTGTTDDHADAWFCGYTAELATCVWVGRPSARIAMEDVHGIAVTGGSFPAQIWHAFMSQVPTPDDPLAIAPISGPSSYTGSSSSETSQPSSGGTGGGTDHEPGPAVTPPAPSPSPSGGLICILNCG